ncbi:MAG: metallophosphoesterase [Coriobacteriia bacterium]
MKQARTTRTGRVALDVLAVVVALSAGIFVFTIAAQGHLDVGPARLEVSLAPAVHGATVVDLPPLGTVSAHTHRGPVELKVTLQEVDFVSAARSVEDIALSAAGTSVPEAISSLPISGLKTFLWRVLGGGFLGAALASLVVCLAFRRSRAVIALAVALSIAVPASALGLAASSWDVSAFREPTLQGNLSYAPSLIDIFSTRVANIDRLRGEASKLAEDLAAYYADDRFLMSGGSLKDTYRVLHITDQHLDLVGGQLARSIARSYETSLVVNTGDLPILGVPLEGIAFSSLVDTSVRQVYVPGNHDSPASIAALQELGVTVITSGTVEVDGFTIFGVPDPISRDFGIEPDSKTVAADAEAAYEMMEDGIRSGESTPNIVAVHNPLMEKPFVGKVPLILSGHTHSARLYISRGTVRLNSGTLGGMAYDPATTGRKVLPYSASVLYFTAELPRRLIAIDQIAVYPQGSTTVTREVINKSLLP